MNEERDFKHRPWQGVIIIPDGLLKYRISGKGIVPFNIQFKPSQLNKKIAEWQSEGLSFVEVKN